MGYHSHMAEKSSLQGLKTFLKGSGLADDAYARLGSIPRPLHLVEILDQFWPECYTSGFNGKTIMAPEGAARLEALYKMFGVRMLVNVALISMIAAPVLGHQLPVATGCYRIGQSVVRC